MDAIALARARSLDFRRTPASKIDFQLCELLLNVSKPFFHLDSIYSVLWTMWT